MRAKGPYVTRDGDEWFRIVRAGHLVACCDCGKVHLVRSRLSGRHIEIMATPMPRNTGGRRSKIAKKRK